MLILSNKIEFGNFCSAKINDLFFSFSLLSSSPWPNIFVFVFDFDISVDSRRRQWHPTPVLLPGKSHGWRRLVGCSPWGREESDITERLHFHFSLSCIGEGSGNPLQRSYLENPRDEGAWWAAVYGVAQSSTQLKQLSSSSSSILSSIEATLIYISRPY